MTAKIIDGKQIAARIRGELVQRVQAVKSKLGRNVALAVISVGDDPASAVYVNNKIKACREAGINSPTYKLNSDTEEKTLAELISRLNADNGIDGILVQLPLPKHIDENKILAMISPSKDVDGFHAVNVGNLLLGNRTVTACTPKGCLELIRSTGIDIDGKHAVVVGRSNIVGKPMAALLLEQNATVTIAHSHTRDLKSITLAADILVVAVGKKEFITGDMIKRGAVVIDVGMNRCDGKLYGDVCFEQAAQYASYITPVPGGVGPMTVAMLLSNTVEAAENA